MSNDNKCVCGGQILSAAEIKEKAEKYRNDCVKFMRDLIKIPGVSCKEKGVAERIMQEMKRLNYDKVWADDYGNVIGQIGHGPIRVVFDSHIDTVDIGSRSSWSFDPHDGKIEDGYIYGRGASDNHNGTVPQVYGAALFKEIGKGLDKVTIFVVGSVQEEDCDGLGLQYALEHSIKNVHYVCMGEATNMKIYRGHRGRMEINVHAKGISCHGSAPDRGQNAVYRMAKLVNDIEKLNDRLQDDPFLGKGTCAVSFIDCETPSLCAVPDACRIHIDRRLTKGEDKALAVRQIEELPSFNKEYMRVEILKYDAPSYTGKVLETEKYFPTWVLEENHSLVQAARVAAKEALGREPEISRWVFSTNGVFSMGRLGIPTIGFGPATEEDAHSTKDRIKIDDMMTATVFYTRFPYELLKIK
ncbi:MAG: YgeY family selenium metabolism-linked hydrolase [Oligoflexia bacterium]|nr:YgeY family selenium metabolism-linked hydrolase [Oligoflexia bacterium]